MKRLLGLCSCFCLPARAGHAAWRDRPVARRAARRCGRRRPQQASGKGSITQVAQPYLVAHLPAQRNGMAMLVISGGGYAHIEAGKESAPAAAWLQAQGIAAFELVYRLPREGGGTSAPFQDAQRAMRLLRSSAAQWQIDPARIGVLGFSAGAHLAGMTAVRPDAPLTAAIDAIDSGVGAARFCRAAVSGADHAGAVRHHACEKNPARCRSLPKARATRCRSNCWSMAARRRCSWRRRWTIRCPGRQQPADVRGAAPRASAGGAASVPARRPWLGFGKSRQRAGRLAAAAAGLAQGRFILRRPRSRRASSSAASICGRYSSTSSSLPSDASVSIWWHRACRVGRLR